jgi:hypothetical protein
MRSKETGVSNPDGGGTSGHNQKLRFESEYADVAVTGEGESQEQALHAHHQQ